jgi:hypothetical protein
MSYRFKAGKIVEIILEDITDRKGLRQAWEGIDEDIQQEIIAAWREAAFEVLADMRT